MTFPQRSKIFLYLGFLIVLLNLGAPTGGVIDIPVSFFLKNKLHLEAHEVANFRLIAAIPLFFSFLFGFIRDTWHPFNIQDRGMMVVFGVVSAGLYLVFAAAPLSYTTLLLTIFCHKFKLKTLLVWFTLLAIQQFIPMLFIHSVTGALIAAVPIGLLGGAATAAYLDLIIRSSPRGLQGTTFMMSGGLFYVGQRFGDVLGTSVYDYYHSFTPCVIMITIVYASILPMLLLVPKSLIAFADGETTDFETAAFAER